VQTPWLLMGDFNLIYKELDKTNGGLNRRLMLRFRKVLNQLEVKEVELVGKKFTWSNIQDPPTLTRIDRAFCTLDWEELYANPILQALSSSHPDHCPLLLLPLVAPAITPRFRFESHWVHMLGFFECVTEAWTRDVPINQNAFGVLHIKLSRTAKALKIWSKSLIPHVKLALAICREVINQLEKAQEDRNLTSAEISLIRHLKKRILGLAVIQKSRARQRSRLTWMRYGDANTRYFHLMANAKRRRITFTPCNQIVGLQSPKEKNHKVIYDHFLQHIGSYTPRECKLNLAALGWQPRSLQHLDYPVSKELHKVNLEAPKESPWWTRWIYRGIFQLMMAHY
jgi:hypothetical protein